MKNSNSLARALSGSLSALPNPFVRLVFLSSLRDSYTGHYFHEGWATVAAAEEVHRAIQQRHLAAFHAVLVLPLFEMCGQLQEHFTSLDGSPRDMAKLWLEIESFREMLPVGCGSLERDFFISQMRAALGGLIHCRDFRLLREQSASQPLPPDQ